MRYRSLTVTLMLGFLLLCAAPQSDAASLLKLEATSPHLVGEEPSDKVEYSIWIEKDRLREDSGEKSVIVDRRTKRMYVIRHASKEYWALELPLDFESMVPEDLQAQWKLVLESRKTEVAIAPGSTPERIGAFDAARHDAVVTSSSGGKLNLSMWISTELGFDTENYKELILEIAKMQPGTDSWKRELFKIKGFPVRFERRFEAQQGTATSAKTLLSVEQKEAPESIWLPADGYTETPFNLLTAPIN